MASTTAATRPRRARTSCPSARSTGASVRGDIAFARSLARSLRRLTRACSELGGRLHVPLAQGCQGGRRRVPMRVREELLRMVLRVQVRVPRRLQVERVVQEQGPHHPGAHLLVPHHRVGHQGPDEAPQLLRVSSKLGRGGPKPFKFKFKPLPVVELEHVVVCGTSTSLASIIAVERRRNLALGSLDSCKSGCPPFDHPLANVVLVPKRRWRRRPRVLPAPLMQRSQGC